MPYSDRLEWKNGTDQHSYATELDSSLVLSPPSPRVPPGSSQYKSSTHDVPTAFSVGTSTRPVGKELWLFIPALYFSWKNPRILLNLVRAVKALATEVGLNNVVVTLSIGPGSKEGRQRDWRSSLEQH